MLDRSHASNEDGIAVVGMAGRFPGAMNVEEFWHNLENATDSVTVWDTADNSTSSGSGSVRAAGVIASHDLFDANFFGITPREAQLLDPQQRLLLESAWEAIESSGYDPKRLQGTVGVYVGSSESTYLRSNLTKNREVVSTVSQFELAILNGQDFLPTRISYKLGLQGPSIAVQTGCSSSLVAIHLACQSLLTDDCDFALAGGVSVQVPQNQTHPYQEGGIHSPNGKCRPFDVNANGTVFGSGAGLVVLRRLRDAIADGDPIHAILIGSAINNDGALKVGYTAPSVIGQREVIQAAIRAAKITPGDISYVETHGTGTRLGDPIEAAGLVQAFSTEEIRDSHCAIGSVKSNIGHLDAAAGIAGLIKTICSLKHRKLPATLHFSRLNPNISFQNSPFYINSRLATWDTTALPLRAGVSSFGIGGTNAHVILQEAPSRTTPTVDALDDSNKTSREHLVLLSAKSESALERQRLNLIAALTEDREHPLADVAYTLQLGRSQHEIRLATVCDDVATLVESLQSPTTLIRGKNTQDRKHTLFMFPGQGAQQPNMGAGLINNFEEFRKIFKQGMAYLHHTFDIDIERALQGDIKQQEALDQTQIAQPALFLYEYALAKQLICLGIVPEAMIGHSVGEYTAACLANVFSFEQSLSILAERGRLMQQLSSGGMTAVGLSSSDIQKFLSDRIALAAVNGPALSVVSGDIQSIIALEQLLTQENVAYRRLRTSHAFHSPMMDPILEEFTSFLDKLTFNSPEIPYISSITGDWITDREATSPTYWADHLRKTVNFFEGLQTILHSSHVCLLEVGPGATLTPLARRHPARTEQTVIIPMQAAQKDQEQHTRMLLQGLGEFWVHGGALDWSPLHDKRRRLSLPTYPFERQRYWIEPDESAEQALNINGSDTIELGAGSVWPEQVEDPEMSAEIAVANGSVIAELQEIFAKLLGVPADDIDKEQTFLRMGAESLLLLQASQLIRQQFNITIPFRALLEEYPTVSALALYIDRNQQSYIEKDAIATLPAEPDSDSIQGQEQEQSYSQDKALPRPYVALDGDKLAPTSMLLDIYKQQLELMKQQLELFQESERRELRGNVSDESPLQKEVQKAENHGVVTVRNSQASRAEQAAEPHFANPSPISPIMTPSQQEFIDGLIRRLATRTRRSREQTQLYRRQLADSRNSAGFNPTLKGLIYPIVANRATEAHFWDIDNNEYIDIAMGYGSLLFGHSPDFIIARMKEQLSHGLRIGPQSDLIGQVADQICKMTHKERVMFCNSGTEAVMTALRIARAVTGRQKIAIFSGSYHGTYDGVMALPESWHHGIAAAAPMGPGQPSSLLGDTVLLENNNPSAIAQLRTLVPKPAAILIEPVQSRNPHLTSEAFLKEVCDAARAMSIPVIFDEVISGFRVHQAGVQGLYGLEADITVYGKAIGGGMPVGVIAGKSQFMDTVDGGWWSFEDASSPTIDQVFATGTYWGHPLLMPIVSAVLAQLAHEGSDLQERLNNRTRQLTDHIDERLRELSIPIQTKSFGSLFGFRFGGEVIYPKLFYTQLLELGIYTWEGPTCYLSTAHTEEDLERIGIGVIQAATLLRNADLAG